MDALIWAAITLAFVGYETLSLWRDDDGIEPFTFYVRRVLRLEDWRAPLFWLSLGFWCWLGFHFFVDEVFL